MLVFFSDSKPRDLSSFRLRTFLEETSFWLFNPQSFPPPIKEQFFQGIKVLFLPAIRRGIEMPCPFPPSKLFRRRSSSLFFLTFDESLPPLFFRGPEVPFFRISSFILDELKPLLMFPFLEKLPFYTESSQKHAPPVDSPSSRVFIGKGQTSLFFGMLDLVSCFLPPTPPQLSRILPFPPLKQILFAPFLSGDGD